MKKGSTVFDGQREATVTALNYDDDRVWQVEIVYKSGTPPWNVAWIHPSRLTSSPVERH